MRLLISALAVIAASATGFVVVAGSRAAGTPTGLASSDGGIPACIIVQTESRYVPYGYNHVILLTNGCTRAATCATATDVNPAPSVVEVPSGATVEVVTFMGSPSSTFVAHVTCSLHENGA